MTAPAEVSSEAQPFVVYTPAAMGAALRYFREKKGLTQAQLAELTGLNRTYLSDMEQGKETEQLRRLLRVLNQLGVRVVLREQDR